MSGDIRRLNDSAGMLRPLVQGLHDVARELDGLAYALVGGLAVLTHVQGHRVTEDIDNAIRGTRSEVSTRLGVVTEPKPGVDLEFTTSGGALVDVLLVGSKPPRTGIGQLREAKGHALRWAVSTAVVRQLDTTPPSDLGPIAVPVAEPAPLIALKCVSASDHRRGHKRDTDLLDLWRLLAHDPLRSVDVVAELADAPQLLRTFVVEYLEELLHYDAVGFVRDMASGPGAAMGAEDVRDLWESVLKPELRRRPADP